jgi:hypothetical protein
MYLVKMVWPRSELSGVRLNKYPQEEEMAYIKKPHELVSRALKLERPVSELLDDYSRFVECTPDHVANGALRRFLWRDPEYRKWRQARLGTDSTKKGNEPTTTASAAA